MSRRGFEGEGAGFVEEDAADVAEAGPEGGVLDEDAAALEAGGGELVGEGKGHAEGAGAGDDEDGDGDLDAAHGIAGGDGPGEAADEAEEEDDEEVGAEDAFEGEVAGGAVAVLGEGGDEGIAPGFLAAEGDGMAVEIDGPGGDATAGREGDGFGFPGDPGEGKLRAVGGEESGDGDDRAAGDEEFGAFFEGIEGDGCAGGEGDGGGDGGLAEHLGAHFFRGTYLQIAAGEHEEGEDGDEVEVEEVFGVEDPSGEGAGVGEEDAEGDGEVDVEDAVSEGGPGAFDEVAAADEEAEGGGEEGDEGEDGGEGEVVAHAEVAGEGEDHGIEGEGTAEAEAGDEGVAFVEGGGIFLPGFEFVAEAEEGGGEGGDGGFAGLPSEVEFAGGGEDIGAEAAGLAEEDLFDEPDAADAGDSADAEEEGGGAVEVGGLGFGGGAEFLEPGELGGLEGAVADGLADGAVLQVVEAFEALALDEIVDEFAATTAEVLLLLRGGEFGATMGAGGHSLLESESEVDGEAVLGDVVVLVGEGDLVGEAEVEGFREAAAEAEGGGGVVVVAAVCGAPVDEVGAFEGSDGRNGTAGLAGESGAAIAFIKDGEPVEFDEGDEPIADLVADVGADEAGGGEVVVEGDLDPGGSGKLPLVVELQVGEAEVEGAVALALEDIAVSGGDLDHGAAGEDELLVRVEDEGVFQAGGEVGESGFGGESVVGIEVDVAVLVGDEGEPVVEGVLQLDGEEVEVAAEGEGAAAGAVDVVGEVVVHPEGVDVGPGEGEIEAGGVGDRSTGVLEAGGGGFEGRDADQFVRTGEGGGGEGEEEGGGVQLVHGWCLLTGVDSQEIPRVSRHGVRMSARILRRGCAAVDGYPILVIRGGEAG